MFLSCPSPYTASQRGRAAWSLRGRGCRRPRTHRAPPPAAELASLTHEDHPLFLIFWSPNSTNLSVLVLYWHIKSPTEHIDGGNLVWAGPDTSESRFATTAPAEPPPADQHHLAVKDISSARITYDDKVVMSTDPPHVGNSVFRIPSCRTIELHQLWGEINRLVSKQNHEKIQKASNYAKYGTANTGNNQIKFEASIFDLQSNLIWWNIQTNFFRLRWKNVWAIHWVNNMAMFLLEIHSSFRKCLDVQANTTRKRFCKANISYMANGQVLRIACRQSQRSVCFVKQFATVCAIHGDCYIMC